MLITRCILVVAIFSKACYAFPVELTKWLALGSEIKVGEAEELGIDLDEWNVSYPTSTMLEVGIKMKHGKIINHLIACAVRLNGHVSLVRGGLEQEEVVLRYVTENGEPDELFIVVQSYKENRVRISDNVAETANIAIVADGMRKWT